MIFGGETLIKMFSKGDAKLIKLLQKLLNYILLLLFLMG